MNRLTIDLEALRHNIQTVDDWITAHDASWTLVTKCLCGHVPTLQALHAIGIRSMAESRLGNLESIASVGGEIETWYLRLPHMPKIADIVRLTDVSLNSEIEAIRALSEEAQRQDRMHSVVIMVELGDLREGVLPGSLAEFYTQVFDLPNIEVIGIGANLGCLSGTMPNVDLFAQLGLYREWLELKFGHQIPYISAGTSIALPLLRDGTLPKAVNHFRIGESVFLGTDLIRGDNLLGLRDDAFTLEAEVVEVKEKSMVAVGETNDMTPFEAINGDDDDDQSEVGERGYRALCTVGQVDTEVAGLTPLDPEHKIVGASSDLTVVSVGSDETDVRVGDTIKFRPSYGALVRLMLSRYIDKVVTPSVDTFSDEMNDDDAGVDLPPILDRETEAEEV